jgi:serine phosphatase RsbU (regulator of sigma subunit)
MQTTRLLGGDDYDLFQISDDVVDVVIADVSGKGAPHLF